jgi:Protein of unknown function (DUF2961)
MLLAALLLSTTWPAQDPAARITFASLVKELENVDALARFPDPPYRALRATSYNRESVAKDKPGWFADSDGTAFIREETNSGRHEWVIQEQQGPGCITKIWTPYFYYDLKEHVGPRVRIYLDGASEPLLDLPLIELVTQDDWRKEYGPKPPRAGKLDIPWIYGGFTARAGNLYLPIPFAKGCKVTLDGKPFYYSVDSRSYPAGTQVRTATLPELLAEIERRKESSCSGVAPEADFAESQHALRLKGPGAIRSLDVRLATPAPRRLVLRARFDGEECIWCPLGDFFGAPDRLRDFRLRMREATSKGELRSSWTMPYRESAEIEIVDLSGAAVACELAVASGPWTWDARSMHFHASWRPDDVVAGDHCEDWNFLDVAGEGVFVGDQWTVLNLTDGWWGEGDEKIYVDDSVARGFPDHFGTGSEDYYGWAGGVNPTRLDVFSQPFLANIAVGSTDHDSTRGFNILARDRALDAIPFTKRFVFDMEASPGTDQRNPWNLLGYSSVAFWYAKPGAKSNRGADPDAAQRPLMSLEALEARSRALKK